MKTVYDFSVKDRKGKDVSLKEYANEVLLIVNTATKCGFTPQYEELEKLYEKYHSQGFEILDFPCNQFGQQAPGTDESIHEFCKLNFGTEFPRFKKIKVIVIRTKTIRFYPLHTFWICKSVLNRNMHRRNAHLSKI
jgi:glutathione peroxidase